MIKITSIKKLMIYILAMTICSIALGENDTPGTVVKVRGEVVAEIDGNTIKLKKGDKIPAQTFLESQEKSFAIIIFEDKTKLTLGPKSRIQVVNPSTDDDPGLINLLKGQIRNKITKPGKLNKYFVNSKAAAIGVRGTEFIAIYNPNTNSLTTGGFSGEVAIGPSIEGEVTVKAAKKLFKNDREANYYIKSKHFTTISKSNTGTKASAPRLLNPLQFNQLKKNEEPKFSSTTIIPFKTEKKRSSNLPNLPNSNQSVSLSLRNDSYLEKTKYGDGQSQMPPGSIMDLKSGVIIPPPPGSEFDPNSGTYIVDSSFGGISEDGNFIPPEGLKLNDDGSFEIIKNAVSSKDQINYVNKINDLINSARNSEEVLQNPTLDDITNLNEGLSSTQEETDQKDLTSDSNINPAIENLADINVDTGLDSSDTSISMDTSCPGNICDLFDTVAPKSDEASQKTLVQFIIRVNND